LNVDALDAIACILGAVDFLDGKAAPPDELDVAQREGWIWVRQTQASTDRKAPASNPDRVTHDTQELPRPGLSAT
jgi:hypothetical protein